MLQSMADDSKILRIRPLTPCDGRDLRAMERMA